MMKRQCPFDGCTTLVDPAKFGCPRHWFSLSKDHQRRIYACYGEWKRGDIDGEELRRLQQAVLDEHQGVGQ